MLSVSSCLREHIACHQDLLPSESKQAMVHQEPQIIRNPFDWKPDANVVPDFAGAPDPPDDWQCSMQWQHRRWDKSYSSGIKERIAGLRGTVLHKFVHPEGDVRFAVRMHGHDDEIACTVHQIRKKLDEDDDDDDDDDDEKKNDVKVAAVADAKKQSDDDCDDKKPEALLDTKKQSDNDAEDDKKSEAWLSGKKRDRAGNHDDTISSSAIGAVAVVVVNLLSCDARIRSCMAE
jgi:hypothetical protein